MDQQYIIICYSTSQMLRADSLLKALDVKTDLIPTPSEYGTICSTAIVISNGDKEKAEKILEEGKFAVKGIFPHKTRKLSGLLESLKNSLISQPFKEIMKKVETGETLTKEEITFLLKVEGESELKALYEAADRMRREIVGDVVEVRAAIEFSNYCNKSCHYCGIRRGCTVPQRYRMIEDEILEGVHELHRLGIKTVVLQSGEDDFYSLDVLISLIKRIKKETKMGITLSIGERTYEEYEALKRVGANNYLLKIETTNPEIFKLLHPDDDLEVRQQCAKWLKELGYVNASGNMVGLPGQRPEDLAEDILFFKDMGIHMIGIGPFIPAAGTPFEKYPQGSVEMTLKTVAVTRLVCKNVFIPATTALASIDPEGQKKALQVGANSLMLISTPPKYRANYQIYSNKNMIDLNSAVKAIHDAGRKLPKYLKLEDKNSKNNH